MPTISKFYGIQIRMYHSDHPHPHFHAYYAEYAAKFDIRHLQKKEGEFPRRATELVLQWASQHQAELLDNWRRIELEEGALQPIPPLE